MRRRDVACRCAMLLISPGISLVRILLSLQPPLLLFTFCLLAFAFSMLSMSSGLEDRTLANPDVELDWNEFMSRLAQLHYCVLPNKNRDTNSRNTSASADQPKVQVVDQGKSLAALLPDIELPLRSRSTKGKGAGGYTSDNGHSADRPQNVTVAVSIKGNFHRSVLTEAMSWHAIATGDMIGSRGVLSRAPFQLVMLLWPVKSEETGENEKQTAKAKTPMVLTEVCLVIQGPAALLPKTRAPSRCYLSAIPPQITREVKLQRTAADAQGKQGNICTQGVWTSFTYQPDPALQVLLSRSDLLLVKERLQRSGLFLLALSALLIVGAGLSQHSSPRRFGFSNGSHHYKLKIDASVS